MKRVIRRKKKGRPHGRSKVRILCEAVIGICAVFVLGCLGYVLYYTVRSLPEIDAELSEQIEQIAEDYNAQDITDESLGENADEGFADSSAEHDIETEAETATEIEAETVTASGSGNAEAYDDTGFEEDGTDVEKAFDDPERRELINGVSLNPRYPENQDLAGTLEELMPQITDGCADTYDKVKACYTYLVENCSFSQTVKYTYEQDAYLLLTTNRGSCTYYAAAFHYMMRYIGLDDKLVSSYRILESGESFHRWNEIAIDGIPYVFDTQWEDTLSMEQEIQYVRFFKTYQELEGLYIVK